MNGASSNGAKPQRRGREILLEPKIIAGRVPPHDLDAEAAVLSAILLFGFAQLARIVDLLEPEHFYSDANGMIYRTARELAGEGAPIDLLTVASRLRDREQLAKVGGAAYLAQLTDGTPSVSNLEAHAQIVRDKSTARQTIAACQVVAAEGYGDYGTVEEYTERAERLVLGATRTSAGAELSSAREIVGAAYRSITAPGTEPSAGFRITCGLAAVDKKIGGFFSSDLTVVAGRPGMGKTAFMTQLAINIGERSARQLELPGETAPAPVRNWVAVFSIEMPKDQIGLRMLAQDAHVDVARLRAEEVYETEWPRLTASSARLAELEIHVDDSPAITVAQIGAKSRRLAARATRNGGRLAAVFVDYLQKIKRGPGEWVPREQEVAGVAVDLKALAKELHVPVIALAALSREVENRGKDKRPQLSDLRESGAIESEADAVIFLYRDEYYHRDSDRKGEAEVIIAKQRNGETGFARVRFKRWCCRFEDLEEAS